MSRIFLSDATANAFEADLLQLALEGELKELGLKVWTFGRDQRSDEKSIAGAIKREVRASSALVLLVSRATLDAGANQWMELGYADAFDVPVCYLLHGLTSDEVRTMERGVPPLLPAADCVHAIQWRQIVPDLRRCCESDRRP